MFAALTVCASLAAIVVMFTLCAGAGMDERSTFAFMCWTGAPYLAFSWLAFERHQSGQARTVFAGTVLSGALATFGYVSDLMPFVRAQATGEEVMNCAGPLIEFGLPILQWAVVGMLWFATSPRRLRRVICVSRD